MNQRDIIFVIPKEKPRYRVLVSLKTGRMGVRLEKDRWQILWFD